MVALHDFTPEELEQNNQAMIASLQYIYQQPAVVQEISRLEQQNIVASARERLLAAAATLQGEQAQFARPPLVLLRETVLDEPAPLPALPGRFRPGSRMARLFNTMAAILVVGILIASAALIFTLHRPDLAGVPQAHCPPGDHETLGDSGGLGYLCAQHLYQDLHFTHDDGLYRVTLSRVYADQGQFVIWYHIERKISGRYQPVQLFANISVAFSTDAQPSKIIHLGVGTGAPGMQMFEMPPLLDHSAALPGKKLNVQADLSSILVGMPYSADSNVTGGALRTFPLDAHFTLPLNGSWRSTSLHQTQSAGSSSLTLAGVRYSLSTVSVDLYASVGNLRYIMLGLSPTSFRVGNVRCISNSHSRDFQGFVFSIGGATQNEMTLTFDCSLPGAGVVPGEEATMVISSYDKSAPPGFVTSWTFHFTLP